MATPTHLSFKAGGREARGDRITFDIERPDGTKVTFRLVPNPSILPVLALGSVGDLDASSLDAEEAARAMGSVYDFLRAVLEPSDWGKFSRLAVKLGLDAEDLLPIMTGLVTAIYAGPTGPSSGSPPSPTPTSGSSTVVGLSPVAAAPTS